MDSTVVKKFSYVAFGAGVLSVALSGATYLLGRADNDDREKSAGHFIGLWAPTFFLLAEMLDRTVTLAEDGSAVVVEDVAMEQQRTRDWALTRLFVRRPGKGLRRRGEHPSGVGCRLHKRDRFGDPGSRRSYRPLLPGAARDDSATVAHCAVDVSSILVIPRI